MERNLPIISGTRKVWKIRAFDYNHHITLIMYANTRFQSIEIISDFRTKFAQNCVNDKTFEKINNEIVNKRIVM